MTPSATLAPRLGPSIPYEWWPGPPMLKEIEASGFSWVQLHAPPPSVLADPRSCIRHAQAAGDALASTELRTVLHAPPGLLAGEPHTLLDVREPWEADIAEIPGSLLVPLDVVRRDARGVADRLGDDPLVIVCHHGVRAEEARGLLAAAGASGLVLAGGIDAWAREIDPSLARY